MDPRQMIARLSELRAEGDAIMQQLISSGIPPEEIMAALEGGQQAGPQVPAGVPAGPPPGAAVAGVGGMPGGMPVGGGGMPMAPGLFGAG
jgi:hypothetical protein